uniref:Protein YIPF n=1 Tax=Nannochloropsis gaditana (strain CCMP526) TaxID=1093141 RepID=I2CPI6_NANGC
MMSAAQQQAHGQQNSQYVGQMDGQNSMTLDEPVWQTVKRDLTQVGSKLQVVLLPRENQDGVLKKLKDWDLWGPLLVCLTLSILLSITAPEEQGALVFAAVFFVVWFGAAVVTMNAQLLGGTISFFQSLCILGYCVFPLDIAALANLLIGLAFQSLVVKAVVVAVGFAWATRASVVFIGQVIAPERKVLALFPVFFFYTFLAWLVLIQ